MTKTLPILGTLQSRSLAWDITWTQEPWVLFAFLSLTYQIFNTGIWDRMRRQLYIVSHMALNTVMNLTLRPEAKAHVNPSQ